MTIEPIKGLYIPKYFNISLLFLWYFNQNYNLANREEKKNQLEKTQLEIWVFHINVMYGYAWINPTMTSE